MIVLTIEKCYSEERESLVRYGILLMGNAFDAEDILHEAMIVAINNEEKWTLAQNKVAWLRGVMKNLARNEIRKRIRETNYLQKQQGNQSDIVHEVTNVSLEYGGLIPDKDLSLLILFYCDGYHLNDLASMYGIGLSACKMRILRARGRLKALIIAA